MNEEYVPKREDLTTFPETTRQKRAAMRSVRKGTPVHRATLRWLEERDLIEIRRPRLSKGDYTSCLRSPFIPLFLDGRLKIELDDGAVYEFHKLCGKAARARLTPLGERVLTWFETFYEPTSK